MQVPYGLLLHIGIDWICIVRVATGCLALVTSPVKIRFHGECTRTSDFVKEATYVRLIAAAMRVMRKIPNTDSRRVVDDMKVELSGDDVGY